MDLPTPIGEFKGRERRMAYLCTPKIPMAEHESIVVKLMYQRDAAEKECKSVIQELKIMTAELEGVTKIMKDQSDLIETYLTTIRKQHTEIEELEARIAALEKDDPDMSIYEEPTGADDETEEFDDERKEELDLVNTCVVLILVLALCLAAVVHVVGNPNTLSETDL